MIREEFGGPVDLLGVSTGGSLVQQFAANYPNLVRWLVIHSGDYTLSEPARALELEVGCLAAERRWRAAWATLLRFALQPAWFAGPQAGFAALILSLDTPQDPSDLLITIVTEERCNFAERLAEIAAPTLVLAGEYNPF